MIKFIEKNKESVDKLNKFIDDNREDIRMITLSFDLFYFFRKCFECTDYQEKCEYMEESMKYRGVRMVCDVYNPANRLFFVRKSESIEFNLPCICGCFQDEMHI